MREQAARAKTWEWAWSGIGYGLAAGQYGEILLLPPERRLEEAIEATATLYLPLQVFLFPLRVRGDEVTLEEMVGRATAPGGVMSPCLVVARAEELLEHSARDEAMHTNALQHVTTLVLSAGYVAFLWFAFKYLPDVILNAAGAVGLGEAQLLTAPTGAVRALERYRLGDLHTDAPRVSWTVAPLGVASLGGGVTPGLSIVARF
jgi:hypothetical protein